METSQSHHHSEARQRGFTLIEVLFAMIVLMVGMVALSSLAARTMVGTAQSRFMGLSASLRSEKLGYRTAGRPGIRMFASPRAPRRAA